MRELSGVPESDRLTANISILPCRQSYRGHTRNIHSTAAACSCTKNSHPTSPHTSSPHTKHEYTPRIPSDPILSGTYSTTCPTATSLFGPEDFGPDDFSMTIARDPARGVWWATFR